MGRCLWMQILIKNNVVSKFGFLFSGFTAATGPLRSEKRLLQLLVALRIHSAHFARAVGVVLRMLDHAIEIHNVAVVKLDTLLLLRVGLLHLLRVR